jgi:hypothetical protein
VATQLVAPLRNRKKKPAMGENSNTFEVHPDNIVPVTLEDLSEEERKEIQRELEEEMRHRS